LCCPGQRQESRLHAKAKAGKDSVTRIRNLI
jgi:hypothetical protein